MDSGNPMELVFLLQKNAWFISHERHWYRLDTASIDAAVSVMRLVTLDPADLVEQPVHGGSASLELTSRSRFVVRLSAPDGKRLDSVRLRIDRQSLAGVAWLTRPWDDGWVPAETTLELENVGSLTLRAFLPGGPGKSRKKIEVHDIDSGSVVEHWIERDKGTALPLVSRGKVGRHAVRIVCEPEAIADSSDPRRLGFLLTGERMQAA